MPFMSPSAAHPQNMLHITRPFYTPTQNLIETTRGLAFRSQAVSHAMNLASGGEGRPERTERGGERPARGGASNRGGRRQGGTNPGGLSGGAMLGLPNGDAESDGGES